MRIDMKTWLGLPLRVRKFGEGLRYSKSSRICSTFANTHEIRGVVARYGNKKRRFEMLLCFGGIVLVLLFCVRGSKVWHAQTLNPLKMLVVPTFSTSTIREVRSEDNCDLNGNPSIAVAKIRRRSQTQACCEACEPCDLLWKLTLSYMHCPDL